MSKKISEASYPGNVGFEEMVLFYRLANKVDLKLMEKAIDKSDWVEFKKLIEKVTGIELK